MAKIIWSDLAKEHLREIDSYISKGAPFYSIIFIDRLIASVEMIRCNRSAHDAGCSMLDPRCSMLVKDSVSRIEHPESSIEDRGSRLCLCALVAERLREIFFHKYRIVYSIKDDTRCSSFFDLRDQIFRG
ncbi:MAG: type II toxin-antitoxin system RelE/ParE family toxin [bacterium]